MGFSNKEKIEMGLFIARYLTSLLIFVLGLKAPGITTYPYAGSHERLEEDQDTTPQEQSASNTVTMHSGSAFKNAFKKLRKLFPYLWPKSNIKLQAIVCFCLVLLLVGRVVKLFLPIYRGKLGKFNELIWLLPPLSSCS